MVFIDIKKKYIYILIYKYNEDNSNVMYHSDIMSHISCCGIVVWSGNDIFAYHVSSYYSLNALPSAVAGEDTKGCSRDYLQRP